MLDIIQLVGKSALAEPDKVTLDVAGLIKEDFLQQNGYSDWDRFCPLYKTEFMMKGFVTYYNLAKSAVENGGLTWAKVRDQTSDVFHKLSGMKFEKPDDGQEALTERYNSLISEIKTAFEEI